MADTNLLTDREFDRAHLWHPYTSITDPQAMLIVSEAQGCELILDDGTRLIDGMASWWSAIQGYNHPVLNQAIVDQLPRFAHVMFGGLTHEPAIRLGRQLLALTHHKLDAIFYADSGSVAVEVALKMAVQYWQGQGQPEKKKIMTLASGYHGDTFATMALSDPTNGMHQRFSGLIYTPFFLPKPPAGFAAEPDDAYLNEIEQQIARCAPECAALVLEPIVQNAGGMNIYSPKILTALRTLCDQYGLLLVLDEIATGFGRTGEFFAYQHTATSPDILCIGKAMTAGYLSFSATLATKAVAEGISGPGGDPLMHGPTYMGNALAACVASANIDLLQQTDWQAQVKRIENRLQNLLPRVSRHGAVSDVRVLGAIGVVEVDRSVNLDRCRPMLLEQGVWLRPFRNLIYCMPPYCISDDQIERIVNAIDKMVGSGAY